MNKKKHYRLMMLSLACFCGFLSCFSQDVPGMPDTIFSRSLHEYRFIRLILPDNYKQSANTKYDVLYVLDAEDDARKILNIERFAEQYAFVPRCIIVNIFTIYFNDRDRDFSPSHVESFPTSGGAPNFLAFRKDELLPYIDKKYPTSGMNTLYGHSMGGLFSLYTLIEAPQLFTSWIVTDPSLWWDNHNMNKLLNEKLASTPLAGKTVWIGSRDGEAHDDMGITEMDAIFKTKAPKGLLWNSVTYPNESHFSLIYKNAYDGLKFSYTAYNPGSMEFHPMDGIVVKDKPFTFYFFNPLPDSPAIRYTTDGKKPDDTSAKMQVENNIQNSIDINIRSFCVRQRYDSTLQAHYQYGGPLHPVKKPTGIVPGGFHYAYYEGHWDSLPDFAVLTPLKSGVADKDFTFGKLPRQNNFGLKIEGYLEIRQEGYYTFLLTSDDGAKLFIGDRLIINENGSHFRLQKSFMVPLKKGYYPIRMEYFQTWQDLALDLSYILPGGKSPVMIPFDCRYKEP
jgi:predicted alpha/beta superfamily hydrolase